MTPATTVSPVDVALATAVFLRFAECGRATFFASLSSAAAAPASTGLGSSATTSPAALSRRSFEGGLTDHPGGGPAREFDLRDQRGFEPADVLLFARGIVAAERALIAGQLLEYRQQVGGHRCAVAGADTADIDEVRVAVDARKQRAQAAGLGGPAAEDHLMTGTAFGLGPGARTARGIGRIEALGDDALEVHPAGREQDGVGGGFEVRHVTHRIARRCFFEQ